jgi:uncharacterized membrane protein AbrB (regulator of aidB expression)
MDLIMNSPAALWSIIALIILCFGGAYAVYHFMKKDPNA